MNPPGGPDAAWPALDHLRIGCVQYLNARPLIHGYRGPVIFDHPSALARDLAAGALDVALVPTFEALRHPHYLLVDGIGIASDGPVFSVFLAHRGPLAEVHTIALDPASLTSVHLLQVLLLEYHALRPQCVDSRTFTGTPDAMLLIGNQAIDFRYEHPDGWHFLDLGEEWKVRTGLPFVYAPWLLRADVPHPQAAADALRTLGQQGLSEIEEIIATDSFRDADFRRRYLTQHIRFGLGEREKRGIEKYRALLTKHRFIAPSDQPLIFI